MAWSVMLLDSGHVALLLDLAILAANSMVPPVRMLGTLFPTAQLCLMSVQAYLH